MLGVDVLGITAASVVGQCLKRGLWAYLSGSGGPVPRKHFGGSAARRNEHGDRPVSFPRSLQSSSNGLA